MFRRQAVAVVGLIALTVVYSLAAGQWRALAALLLLVPLCGLFLLRDGRIVERWRGQLLERWIEKEIDFEAFFAAMRANPRLPSRTLDGMLQTLPSLGDLTSEQTLQPPTRRAIAAACVDSHRRQSDALLLKVPASGIVAVVVLAAAWTDSWRPLIGGVALVLLPVVGAWRRRRRRAICEAEVAACRVQPGFDEHGYERMRRQWR
jgi:hypothetical protein